MYPTVTFEHTDCTELTLSPTALSSFAPERVQAPHAWASFPGYSGPVYVEHVFTEEPQE